MVQTIPDLESDIVQAAVHTARASGKVQFVKDLSKPRGTPRPAAKQAEEDRAFRRNRGMEKIIRAVPPPATRRRAPPEPGETRCTRRRTMQQSSRDDQNAVDTQSCMQAAEDASAGHDSDEPVEGADTSCSPPPEQREHAPIETTRNPCLQAEAQWRPTHRIRCMVRR